MTRKKSIGYIRISSLSQQKGYSLEKQKTNIYNFCKAYDIELISIYQDKKSGRNKNDGLQKLLKKLYKSEAVFLIVDRLDRLFRNSLELLNLLRDFKKYGKQLISIQERLEFNSSNPASELFLSILSVINTFEADTIKERVKLGKELKRQAFSGSDTLYLGGSIPYGMRVSSIKINEKSFKVLVPEQEEMKVINIIKKLNFEKKTLSEISILLNKDGYKTKQKKEFTKTQVFRILKRYSSNQNLSEDE